MSSPSKRIQDAVAALPLRAGMRVLEIGCGPGVAARLVAARIGTGFVLGIDRSAAAIGLAVQGSRDEIEQGRVEFRQAAIEDFVLPKSEQPFDLAFALRVGVLDGRHPAKEDQAMARLRSALVPGAVLYIDGGEPLRMIDPFDAHPGGKG